MSKERNLPDYWPKVNLDASPRLVQGWRWASAEIFRALCEHDVLDKAKAHDELISFLSMALKAGVIRGAVTGELKKITEQWRKEAADE